MSGTEGRLVAPPLSAFRKPATVGSPTNNPREQSGGGGNQRMASFILRRLGVMVLTIICLTFVVFFLANLEPNLRKLAISQTNMRASDQMLESWLERNGYRDNFFLRYGRWIGVWPKQAVKDPKTGRAAASLRVLQGARDEDPVGRAGRRFRLLHRVQGNGLEEIVAGAQGDWSPDVLGHAGHGARRAAYRRACRHAGRHANGPKFVRGAIASTATPEYVSGIILAAIFAAWLGWLNASAATATMHGITFYNFTLPVLTESIYGTGYIARMTRASMAEVMTSQYIRTARLKGLSFREVVLKHALRNALIAPFTVIMLQFPWLLTGVVVVETIFRYHGFGYLLVQAASNNDIDLLLACAMVAVIVVLLTQLISDIGYAFLNPRIRVS